MRHAAIHIDDQLLAERLATGDSAARELLYDKYAAALYGLVLQIVPDRRRAAEVLVNVFSDAFLYAQEYRTGGNVTLFGWLMRKAREMAVAAIGPSAGGHELVTRSNGALQQFAETLAPQVQQVFCLCYFKGLSRETVASITGLPANEVTALLNEAMRALRKFLKT